MFEIIWTRISVMINSITFFIHCIFFQVYRYFAHNCTESFPGIREGSPQNLTDIICETRYSGVEPSTDGEIIYRVLPPNLPIDNPYSEQVQGLLKVTNLRINFTKLHTLGDDLLDRREEIQVSQILYKFVTITSVNIRFTNIFQSSRSSHCKD